MISAAPSAGLALPRSRRNVLSPLRLARRLFHPGGERPGLVRAFATAWQPDSKAICLDTKPLVLRKILSVESAAALLRTIGYNTWTEIKIPVVIPRRWL